MIVWVWERFFRVKGTSDSVNWCRLGKETEAGVRERVWEAAGSGEAMAEVERKDFASKQRRRKYFFMEGSSGIIP